MRHRLRAPAAILAALALGLTACSSSSGQPWTPPPGYNQPSGASLAPSQRIEVKLTDTFRVEPARLSIKAGTSVTFVVTNAGKLEHEIFIGPKADQDLHETEMLAQGTMVHDHDNGIGVRPGETRELTHVFASPGLQFGGCHVPGHYGAGMYAEITVTT
jgi:uncharacterized cupredoxin-like copper-binding protein